MVTGAALATINRPVLLLPSDYFATRAASPLLQEPEDPRSFEVSVNDAFKPVSRYWDRSTGPSSAVRAAGRDAGAHRPAEAGAVTLALPQDAGRGARPPRGAVRRAGLARGPADVRSRPRTGPRPC
jgi:3D-(3,5/4)-trihydroxycyclohexane-1,2-dione acylhydrolase (decyclizing)